MRSVAFALIVVLGACSGGGPGGGGGGHEPGGTCEDTPCGGSPVGTWDLVTFCGPPEVVGAAQTLTFGADGSYGGAAAGGTWEIDSDGKLVITVSGRSSHADFCVGSDLFWWSTGSLTIVRRRVTPGPTRR